MPEDNFKPQKVMLPNSYYDESRANRVIQFISQLKHTKGQWYGQPFLLLPWQEVIIRHIFGIIKQNGYREINTAYVEIGKKQGKTEMGAAIALYMLTADGERGAEVYSCAF